LIEGLTDKGFLQAESAARQLAEQNLIPDVIFCSPLHRTKQTAQRTQEVFKELSGRDIPIILKAYLAESNTKITANDLLVDKDLSEEHLVCMAVTHDTILKPLHDQIYQTAGDNINCDFADTYVYSGQAETWHDMQCTELSKKNISPKVQQDKLSNKPAQQSTPNP
jgi:phosphohistidine phosphatase SixA